MTTTPTPDGDRHHRADGGRPVTTVLHVGNLHWTTEKAVVESLIGRIAGVEGVEANPVAQTATVTYDPAATSVATLRKWVEDCGYHCAGQSVPGHLCLPTWTNPRAAPSRRRTTTPTTGPTRPTPRTRP